MTSLKVVDLNPASCWAFFFFPSFPTFLRHRHVHNQVPQRLSTIIYNCVLWKQLKWMPSCAAWSKTGSISSDRVKKPQHSSTDSLVFQNTNVCILQAELKFNWFFNHIKLFPLYPCMQTQNWFKKKLSVITFVPVGNAKEWSNKISNSL